MRPPRRRLSRWRRADGPGDVAGVRLRADRAVTLVNGDEASEFTRFGGWPWPSDGPAHAATAGRFAIHADGRKETIG